MGAGGRVRDRVGSGTYAFVTGGVPLWPSFIASATYYAAGGGRDGLVRGTASNVALIGFTTVMISEQWFVETE